MTASQVRRIIAATLMALVGLTGTTALGFWQYSRAHRDDIARQVLAAAALPVQSLVKPAQYVPEAAFAHRAAAQGRLDFAQALTSCARVQADGTTGCWVIAPVRLEGEAVAQTLVLGFVPDAKRDLALATVRARGVERTTVAGRLQPGESVEPGRALLHPSTTIANVSINELALRWRTDLLDGYVVLEPAMVGAAPTSPLVLPPSGVTLRNLFYAWQWWTFAAFVLFLLGRYIMDVRADPRSIAEHPAEEH